MAELLDCGFCGEDAFIVSWDGKHMARVRRVTKCKHAKRGLEGICKTDVFRDKDTAIKVWNAVFAPNRPFEFDGSE